jgi:signal transduction histidine kinase
VLPGLKIAVRIRLLIVLAALGMAVCAAIGLWALKEQMLEDRRVQLSNLLDVVLNDARGDMATAGGPGTEAGRKAFLEMIRSVKFGDRSVNYFFVYDYSGVALIHQDPSKEGISRITAGDSNIAKVVRKFIEIAKSPAGSGYIEYSTNKGIGGALTPKLSLIHNVPELNVLIGVGLYIEDVNAIFYNRLQLTAWLFGLALLAIAALGYIISRSIVGPLSKAIGGITSLGMGQLEFPIPNSDKKSELGEVARALNVLRENAIEQRRLQEKVQEQNGYLIEQKEKAEQAVKAKSQFLANMSHELRTPMHAILGFAEICTNSVAEGDASSTAKGLGNITKSGKRLLSLLNDLLDLSKMEAGRMEYKYEKADLTEVIQQALTELDPLIKAKNLKIRVSSGGRTEAVFDRPHMIQVLVNLLSNAIKFTRADSQISIELGEERQPGGEARLRCRVIDEGPGIPDAELQSIFDKFVQSNKTKTGAGGTGLGLAICDHIIQAHGGKIWAENAKPHGAILTFVIPRGAVPEAGGLCEAEPRGLTNTGV